KNVDKFLKKLNKKGFSEADYVLDPGYSLYYVYLEYHPFGLEAVDACVSQLDGRYKDDVWILNVQGYSASRDIAQLENGDENSIVDTIEDNTTPSGKRPSESPIRSKIIQKADFYFNKMWYAQAAELYETALERNEKNHSFDILRKAGDAHYFNTNMEGAYRWYTKLYENYKNQLDAEYIFKYAHALKGTGKYTKSKRMMRLYDRMMENSTSPEKEVLLDELLADDGTLEVQNLTINSEYSDFGPMFLGSEQLVFSSAKDSSFLSTRRYKWNNQPFLDLYTARVDTTSGDLKEIQKLSKKINTKYHEAAVTFSPDKTVIYFTRNNYGKRLKRDKDGVNHLKIYTSQLVDGEWAQAEEVPFNSNDFSVGHPAMSPDGKQLYFVSDMPGSLGKTDIFVVDVLGQNLFSEPRNLGPVVNTEGKEMFPFFDGETLYFSSNGHTGLGGLDVYRVSYDSDAGFGEPMNLGKPINSNKDDFSYIVDKSSQSGYFASNREGGQGDDDIYSFGKIKEEIIPKSINAIAGIVTDILTGEPIPQATVNLYDEDGNPIKEFMTNQDGSFLFEDLQRNTQYTLKTQRENFLNDERNVATADNETVNKDVQLRKLEELITEADGIKKINLEAIHFDFDKFKIRPDAAKELDKLVAVLNEYQGMTIKIESHTDSRGSRAYNKYLSERRAKATRDYIISQGIDSSRVVSAAGYGEDRLLNECDGTVRCSEAQHALNRRSEFIIVKD
ncbi:MAG: OmpA family protein, partial [Bacteroidota bacterium]